jgi:hypothetical protein
MHASAGGSFDTSIIKLGVRWEKYHPLWVAAGGHSITHVSAAETDRALTQMGF